VFLLAVGQLLAGRGQQRLELLLVVRGAQVLHPRAPRRFEYTICTAVAPDAVFTVRT
jgi:hypothetical protein